MSAAVTIERMSGRHIDAVMAVDARCYGAPWSAATWRREVEGDDRRHLVAAEGDLLVGHAGTLLLTDELHVTTVAVDPEQQGRGIATRLLIELLILARADGLARAATLEARAADHRTHRLYARFGFAPAGVRSRYYSNPTDDAVVMWMEDLRGPEIGVRLERIADEIEHPAEVTP